AVEEYVVGPGAVVEVALDLQLEVGEVGELGALERADVDADGAAKLLRPNGGEDEEAGGEEDREENGATHAAVNVVCCMFCADTNLTPAPALQRRALGNYAYPSFQRKDEWEKGSEEEGANAPPLPPSPILSISPPRSPPPGARRARPARRGRRARPR